MSSLFENNWNEVFVPSVHVLEIILRGTLIYLFLFILLRLRRRQAGTLGISDLLLITILADASQNAMAGEYKSITDGIILILTIFGWDYLLDWLSYRFPKLHHLTHPPSLVLIKDGRLLKRNLEQEMMTEQELMMKLREQEVDDVKKVKLGQLEGDGRVSVIKKETPPKKPKPRKKRKR